MFSNPHSNASISVHASFEIVHVSLACKKVDRMWHLTSLFLVSILDVNVSFIFITFLLAISILLLISVSVFPSSIISWPKYLQCSLELLLLADKWKQKDLSVWFTLLDAASYTNISKAVTLAVSLFPLLQISRFPDSRFLLLQIALFSDLKPGFH